MLVSVAFGGSVAATMSDESDDEWLRTLCVAPRPAPDADDSEDEWVRTLCIAPRLGGLVANVAAAPVAISSEYGPAAAFWRYGVMLSRCGELPSCSGVLPFRPPAPAAAARPLPRRRAASRSPHRGSLLILPILPPVVFRSFDGLARAYPDASDIAAIPRQDEFVRSAWSAAPPSTVTIATAREFCLARLVAWARKLGPAIVFKVGIAANPEHRYSNSEFGYVLERIWMFMDIVWEVTVVQRILASIVLPQPCPPRLLHVVLLLAVLPFMLVLFSY